MPAILPASGEQPGQGLVALMVPRTSPGRSTVVIPLGVDKASLPDQDPRKSMSGESYKLTSVGVDEYGNLFVKGNAQVQVPRDQLTPEQLERLRQLPGWDENSREMVTVYQDFPLFLSKDFTNEGDKLEYLNVLKNVAITAGYDGSDQELATKGMEILQSNNERVQHELDSAN